MSATCKHCGVFSRNPCDSLPEAARCGNNDDPGSCLEFNAKDVAAWIRSNTTDDQLLAAADKIERHM